MQLKQTKSIRQQLTAATSTLLVAAPLQATAALGLGVEETEDITVELSRLYYSEEDRVTVNKSQALITNEYSDDTFFRVNIIYDTMSGSSPNGRIYKPSSGAESSTVAVTTASGFSFNAANTSMVAMTQVRLR